MVKNPAGQKALLGKFELLRLVFTLAAVGYLVFFVGRAVLFSPDFLGAVRETILPRAADAELDIRRGVSYVTPADQLRSGDLYLPKQPGKRRAAVILMHGGSWREGSRAEESESARYIARHGYVVFNIDYRLVGQGGEFPHDIRDVKDAMAFLVEHADEYGVDPGKLVLYGSSSGGHMAMLSAYAGGQKDLGPETHATGKARVAAVVSLYGLCDLSDLYVHATIKTDIVNYLNGKTPQDAPELYAKASPLNYGRTAVPTFFAHGTVDHNVPITQSTAMAAALKKNGVRFELVPVEGASHWFGPVTRDQVLSRVVSFLNEILK